jgi:chromosome segregation ATPase
MLRELKEATTQANETVRSLKYSSSLAEESLQSIQEQLTESELSVAALEREHVATRTSLDEQESNQETLSTLQEDLQKKVDALESEQLREASSADLAAVNDTSTSLESVQAEGAETFASVRQELAEAEVCVMVLCDEAKKTLSKRELTLEVLSSEHGELQLKSQSVMTELEALKVKSAFDARITEDAAELLKKEAARAAESLEAAQSKLSESEALVTSLAAERDALSKTLSDLETERDFLSP